MVRISIALIALLFSQLAFALTQVTASIDKNPVMLNESFILEIVADDSVDSNSFDSRPLANDFIVGSTSVQSQTSIINGSASRTTTFKTVLIAQKQGKVTIPALSVAGKTTQEITIDVLAEADPNAPKNKDIFITTDITSNNVYVQEQLTLVVKLYFSTQLQRASLSAPELANANIQQIGSDKEDNTVLNGIRYRVIERAYAINPQQSGEFVIQAPIFSGEVVIQSQRRSSFSSYGQTKPVNVRADNINLTVKPIPTSYQGQWLPSELIILNDEWQPSPEEFIVGEPITRTLTLTAAGLSEEQLPKLSMVMPKGLKVYPDQPQLHTGVNKDKIVSQKVRNFAIVATKPGTYTLPAVTITWWNTVTNREQKSVLNEKVIKVKPNPEFSNALPINNQANEAPECEQEALTVTVPTAPNLQWLFLGLWILTLIAWLLSSLNKKKTNNGSEKSVTVASGNHFESLIKACNDNDGHAVLSSIAPWCNELISQGRAVSTLDEAVEKLDESTLKDAITNLQQCYFSKQKSDWRGAELLSVIKLINTKKQTKKNENSFSLNP